MANENNEKLPIPKDLESVKQALNEHIGLDSSFDVLLREMEFGTKKTGLLYINGFAKDEVLTEILKRLSYLNREELVPKVLRSFLEKYIPHIQVEVEEDLNKAVISVLSGMSAFFIDGETSCIIMDAKVFPIRSIDEPTLEKVARGSRDGFVETMLTNVTLVRRRLRDPNLTYEVMKVGKRTKTDVCIGYLDDIVDKKLVESVRDKIKKIKIDGIPVANKQLEEVIFGKGWNPYPLVRYSERPDVVAAHLLDGHVILFVDTSPSAMILPATLFHHVQHAEEYTDSPFVGTYLRWVRFLAIFASIFVLPVWFLFVIEPSLKPDALEFLGPKKTGELPILIQFLLAEIGADLMRMASIHTPTALGTSLGLISAIVLGEFAVQTGLFVYEVILYLALAMMGMYATPSYELRLANRMVRLILLIIVAFFKVPGLIIGTTLIILILVFTRSFNAPYLWPFIPFDAKAFFTIVLRKPITHDNTRPSITNPQDESKQPT
ncbi:spore germination protein [Chengkuizengella axinellae]|uniref:Spore germination protein n=1 Tax=Chengkuizengella axinellae TaxID=3064388 RepID=A0ABT9IWJ4_9BACL|nr:spore germination protein [Chengkuizengella sp. 2205SS18-9]MDP5273739.1 spore germination protein [Chengkuizengella sp. 2205SS18-9]